MLDNVDIYNKQMLDNKGNKIKDNIYNKNNKFNKYNRQKQYQKKKKKKKKFRNRRKINTGSSTMKQNDRWDQELIERNSTKIIWKFQKQNRKDQYRTEQHGRGASLARPQAWAKMD